MGKLTVLDSLIRGGFSFKSGNGLLGWFVLGVLGWLFSSSDLTAEGISSFINTGLTLGDEFIYIGCSSGSRCWIFPTSLQRFFISNTATSDWMGAVFNTLGVWF